MFTRVKLTFHGIKHRIVRMSKKLWRILSWSRFALYIPLPVMIALLSYGTWKEYDAGIAGYHWAQKEHVFGKVVAFVQNPFSGHWPTLTGWGNHLPAPHPRPVVEPAPKVEPPVVIVRRPPPTPVPPPPYCPPQMATGSVPASKPAPKHDHQEHKTVLKPKPKPTPTPPEFSLPYANDPTVISPTGGRSRSLPPEDMDGLVSGLAQRTPPLRRHDIPNM